MPDILLRVEGVTKRFSNPNGRKQKVLDQASIAIRRGAAVGVVGPSGEGKSTLARIICGTIKPDYSSQ